VAAKPPQPDKYDGHREVVLWLFNVEQYFDAVAMNTD
jgi:hypothetical protein